jgi:hypothetical protein
MQAKVLIINLMISISVFCGLLNSTAFSGDHEKLAKYYESCIVREIAKCDSKLVLLRTSKSKNLQDYAKMEAQKAKFFNAEKEMLVKEMIEMQLKPKHYKVELFLNNRFQERD